MDEEPKKKSGRGFASMDPEKRAAISSLGGKAAHEQGKAHEFDAEEAKAAGMKGGAKISSDRKHMVEIGRRGGQVCGKVRGKNKRKAVRETSP
jgi:general stress protein YciG